MKLKPLLQLWLLSCLCLFVQKIAAQNSENYFMPTVFPNAPNTAAFSKFGNYDVSLFSGVPEINIPIYTIEAGGLKMPITLSYHASGIKVSDVASWAGLGWSINTGGSVTRSIMGTPDEWGYNLPNHQLNPQVNADLDELYTIVNLQTDTRPDIFTYNIPGHSGSFFFNGTNSLQIQKIPFSPLAITAAISSGSYAFDIKDEHGNTFLLGKNYLETSGASGGGGLRQYTATSAWMLEKMISSNKKDTISLSYSSVAVTHPDALTETCTITDQPVVNLGCGTIDTKPAAYTPLNMAPSMTEQQLKTILFKNGRVDFDLSTAPRADLGGGSPYGGANYYYLNDIRISIYNYATKSYEVQKTIKFYQTYFGSSANFGSTGVGNQRLRLDSIQILDKAGSVIQHYRFKYNTTPLPNYASLSRDYWGYYNHKQDGYNADGTVNHTLIPQMTVDYEPTTGVYTPPLPTVTIGSTIAGSRNIDTNYMQACTLDTIYYPTGGYTTFTYQTNRYVDTGGHTQLAGGLRVTSINSYDGINPTPTTKTYQYGPGQPIFFTSNIMPSNGFFTSTSTNRHWGCPDSACLTKVDCSESRTRTFYAQPTVSIDPIDGTPVGYTSVTEYYGTPGNNVGKTGYFYSFAQDYNEIASMSGIQILLSNAFQRGQLLSKTEYLRKSDGTYQIVKTDSNSYSFIPTVYHNVGLVVGERIFNNGMLTRAYYHDQSPDDTEGTFAYALEGAGGNYDIQTGSNYPVSSTTKIYDTNNPSLYTTSTVNYIYGDTTRWQISKVTHVDSKGNTHITMNKYAFDYLSGSTTHNAVLDTMINQNMIGEIVEKWDSVKDVAASANFVSGAQLNTYQFGSLTNSVVPSTISTLSVNSPITNFTPMYVNTGTGTITGDSRYIRMINFNNYDAQNNIAQYTPRNANPTTILWDYLYENPIAQVKNAPFYSTLPTNVAYTSFEADGKGNWYYTGTPVTDLTAPTGKNVYPLSSGTITSNQTLDGTKSYVLSYWSNSGAASVSYNGAGVSGNNLTVANGWTYYEHILPVITGSSQVSISGSTSIDELRLYPANAQMTTYAYEPEGLMSLADTKGGINHFEYDYFARLKNIKDFYGNIVNNYSYHTYDQTHGNQVQSSSFTRNNCPPNTNPGSLTYTVPANKYYSSTLASANAEATYDLNINGQAKANQYCGCPIIYVNITVTNSSGIANFPITFNGISSPYLVPTGTSYISVPQGTYTSVQVGPSGSGTHNYTLTGYTSQNGVHYATFTNVAVNTGTSLTFTIN